MDKTNLKFSGDLQNLEVLEGKYKGTYKAEASSTCINCAFYTSNSAWGTCSFMRCTSNSQPTKKEIIWIKTKETPKPTPRPHANLIKQWLKDANLKVWEWAGNKWNCIVCPTWDEDIIYAVSTEKPTWTPMKKYSITVGTFTTTISLSSSLTEEELEKAIKDYTASLVSYKEV